MFESELASIILLTLLVLLIFIVALTFIFFSLRDARNIKSEFLRDIWDALKVAKVHRDYDKFSFLSQSRPEKMSLKEIYKTLDESQALLDKIASRSKELDKANRVHLAARGFLVTVGRINNIRTKPRGIQSIWFSLNAGLINSFLKHIIYSNKPSEIDKNTIIGLLIGEKIKKDTKSFIYIFISFAISLLLPLTSFYEFNLSLTLFFVFMFSMLILNHKLLEYRIANGFYGGNEYEAREILNFIDSHNNKDDFTSGSRKQVFQSKKDKKSEFEGVFGGLLN